MLVHVAVFEVGSGAAGWGAGLGPELYRNVKRIHIRRCCEM